MRCFVVTNPVSMDINIIKTINKDDYVIAVDSALLFCHNNNIKVDLAIGDFDSLKDHSLLNEYSFLMLNKIKDQTDTLEAIKKAYQVSNDVSLIGGLGGNRIEHSIANLNLLKQFRNLTIYSLFSKCYLVEDKTTKIRFKGYVSIFPYPEANITLEGFKYPLDHHQLDVFDSLGISNEIIDEKGVITVHKGSILVIESEYD
ncbi:thiamine diphosphokinase [Acholeplasma sp. OttesenSCG-928-E16]|nr:thiamine diphosphokinase [Acholeplasma sp. OttesenSCG-928-E16]